MSFLQGPLLEERETWVSTFNPRAKARALRIANPYGKKKNVYGLRNINKLLGYTSQALNPSL
jgi:hypothetical protein